MMYPAGSSGELLLKLTQALWSKIYTVGQGQDCSFWQALLDHWEGDHCFPWCAMSPKAVGAMFSPIPVSLCVPDCGTH